MSILNAMSRPLLAVLLVLGSSGCSLLDPTPTPRLLPGQPVRTEGLLTLQVECQGVTNGEFLVDGKEIVGAFRVGVEQRLDLTHLAEGTHHLQAAVHVGTSVRLSDRQEIVIDRSPPRLLGVSPGSNRLTYSRTPEAHFSVAFQFDEPLDPVGVTTANVSAWSEASTTGYSVALASSATLEDSNRRLVITLDRPLAELGRVHVSVIAYDPLGHVSMTPDAWWAWPGLLNVTLLKPEALVMPIMFKGVQDIVATWDAATFGQLDLLLDDVALGPISSGVPFRWDSSSARDGAHRLSFSAPGMQPFTFYIVASNWGPRVVSCEPIGGTTEDASVASGILVTFDRDVCVVSPDMLCRGDRYLEGGPVSGRPPNQVIARPKAVTVPADLTLTFDRIEDAFGKSAGPQERCSAHFPAWRQPLDPVNPDAGLLGEASIFLSGRSTDSGAYVSLLRIPPAPSASAGTVQHANAYWFDPPATRWQLNTTPWSADLSSTASQLVGGTWLETGAGGVTVHQKFSYGRRDSAALDAAAAPFRIVPGDLAAWLERNPAGGLQFRFARMDRDPSGTETLVARPPLVAASVGGSIIDGSAADVFGTVTAAVVNLVPGAPATLSTWRFDETTRLWTSWEPALNVDPLMTPRETTMVGDIVPVLAWTEGSKVWIRNTDRPGAPMSFPEMANSGSTSAARMPRIAPWSWWVGAARVVFVEDGASGDVVQVREYRPGTVGTAAWRPLSPFQTSGHVSALSVHPGPPLAVLVTFDTGERILLVYNE